MVKELEAISPWIGDIKSVSDIMSGTKIFFVIPKTMEKISSGEFVCEEDLPKAISRMMHKRGISSPSNFNTYDLTIEENQYILFEIIKKYQTSIDSQEEKKAFSAALKKCSNKSIADLESFYNDKKRNLQKTIINELTAMKYSEIVSIQKVIEFMKDGFDVAKIVEDGTKKRK